MESLAQIGERGLIARLRPILPTGGDVRIGAGDDCAVVALPPGEELVLKSDPILEGHHFVPGEDPRRIGRKALGRVLSDFAAMGATPRWALLDFTAPADTPVAVADGIYEGLRERAAAYGVAIVGGDTSRGDGISLHVFAAGSVPAGTALRRSAARPGDALYLTGRIGRSFESGHHLDFRPRLPEGDWLRCRPVHACIDLSDGLASELWHIAEESGMRLEVDDKTLPLSDTCRALPDPVAHAYADGEDFELLFSAPETDTALPTAFRAAFPDTPLTRIGSVSAAAPGGGLVLRAGEPLPKGGFDHFKRI